MAKHASPLPADLSSAARRFAEWRKNRTTRRIPDELWSLAADLGARHGLSRTARALRVDYYGLKKRIDAAAAPDPSETVAPPAFVSILTAPSAEAADGLIEFERAGGEKMRIHWKGGATPDLAALSRLFLWPRS